MDMQSKIRIQNGNFHLTASGIFITANDQPLIFTIIDNGEPLDIVMKFVNDESIPNEVKRQVNKISDRNGFEIIFKNYNAVLGTYTKDPWLIGNAFNRKLYIVYKISGFSESPLKEFVYSLYLGEEVTHG